MLIQVDVKFENYLTKYKDSEGGCLEAAGWKVGLKYPNEKDCFMDSYKTCSKNFDCDNPQGAAMRDFEKATGRDVTEDAMNDNVTFWWQDGNDWRSCMAWECGKYMFPLWERTPRGVLEKYNAQAKLSS